VPKGRPIVIDGLAFGVLPEAAETLSETHPLIALVHHPLALETGLTPERPRRCAKRAPRLVLYAGGRANSRRPRARLRRLRRPAERITVAPPGTDRAPQIRRHIRPIALLAVGSVVPRKGYDLLVEALAGLLDLPWQLTIVGDARDPRRPPTNCGGHRASQAQPAYDRGRSPVSRLAELYGASDLFVLPSRYEGFGMAYAEAIAHGLPVIGTTGGRHPGTVPRTAGILVPPDDVPALAAALRR
jgi:glycosyltransferase involved in cell wall biosynthesis